MIDVRHYGTNGPGLVLLHGGPGGPGYMAGLARDLCDHYQILEPLQRISGGEPITVAQHVADLDEVIQSVAEPVRLVGSSWGAMLALTYAARHPQHVAQVVLIGCGTFDARSRAVFQERMNHRMDANDKERMPALETELATETDPARRDVLFAELCDIAFRTQSYELVTTDFEIVHYDERGFRETWADVIRLQDTGVQPTEFGHIRAPVRMLHGQDDPHPGRLIHDSLVPIVKYLEYHEFQKCGHLPWLEKHARKEFLSVLMAALEAV